MAWFNWRRKPATVFGFAKVNARVMPFTRGDWLEDPLTEAIEKAGLGTVTGSGTGQQENGEVAYCGIDVEMTDLDKTPQFICTFLSERGAPKGSELQYQVSGKDKMLAFGQSEGIAIYLNGTDLPSEVYETCQLDHIVDTINGLIGPTLSGSVLDSWEGPSETALYLYGKSAAGMKAAIAPFMAEYPLCRQARIVDITPVT